MSGPGRIRGKERGGVRGRGASAQLVQVMLVGLCVTLGACTEQPQQAAPPPARSAGLAPAARSAIGAYAVSGETPWSREGVEELDAPPTPPMPPKPRRYGAQDAGGVAL